MIAVMNCGHDSRHKTKFHMLRKTGVPNYILLLVKTEAFFELNGSIETTAPNMAILFDRNSYMHYGSKHSFYNDDWIHFDMIGEPDLLEQLHIPFRQPIYLPQISQLSNYVRMLVQESHADTPHRQELQDALMRLLLYSLDSQIMVLPAMANAHKHYQRIHQLRINIHNTPHKKWTVDAMAEYVHMSPYYFQHLYKKLYHISCIQEVILARIERAKFYLTTTDMSVRELADSCGYENEMHFIRQFKKKEGLTPTQFRRLYHEHQPSP